METLGKKAWDKKYTVRYAVKLNRNQDADLIEYMEQFQSKGSKLRELIRAEVERIKAAAE